LSTRGPGWLRLAILTDTLDPRLAALFNVGGGGYRVVVAIHFNRQKLYIRHVFTHAEYDRWSARLRSGK